MKKILLTATVLLAMLCSNGQPHEIYTSKSEKVSVFYKAADSSYALSFINAKTSTSNKKYWSMFFDTDEEFIEFLELCEKAYYEPTKLHYYQDIVVKASDEYIYIRKYDGSAATLIELIDLLEMLELMDNL